MPARLLRQYAAIFFFAPLVQLRLDHHDFGLSTGDKHAIRLTIRWGYVIFGLGLMFLVVSVIQALFNRVWLPWAYWSLMAATLLSIAVGVWKIHHPSNMLDEQPTSLITNRMLLAYLPGYNRYLRYTTQDPHRPYRRLKESILRWYMIMICLILPWLSGIGMFLIAMMIIRLVILAAGYDIVSPRIKQWLNRHYTLHVDECRAYASAGIKKLRSSQSYQSLVTADRRLYRHSLPRQLASWRVIDRVSYGILGLLLGWILRYTHMQNAYMIMAPIVWWGYGLLSVYAAIRWRTSGWSPVPFLHPLVRGISNLLKHKS